MKMLTTRHKWEVIAYTGSPWPVLSGLEKSIIRKQLDERYCPRCGEYIYNPYRGRKVRHYHFHGKRPVPLLYKRVVVHPRVGFVEWARRFPRVMRLVVSPRDMTYFNSKPIFVRRIPALRMWTIDEWNATYPDLAIPDEDGLKTIRKREWVDMLHTPDLAV